MLIFKTEYRIIPYNFIKQPAYNWRL